MLAFIGLLIQASVQKSGPESLNEIWSTRYGRSIFRACMSQTRFKELLRFCLFGYHATRDTRLATDKLAPIRDCLENVPGKLTKCLQTWKWCDRRWAAFATRGRCSFRQYISSKPGKYGIKIYWACDSETSYPLRSEVYIGKQPANASNVMDLVKRLPWQKIGRNVSMDHYFTSYDLAIDILALRTTIVRTMRKNQSDIPKEIQSSNARQELSSVFGFERQLTLRKCLRKERKWSFSPACITTMQLLLPM